MKKTALTLLALSTVTLGTFADVVHYNKNHGAQGGFERDKGYSATYNPYLGVDVSARQYDPHEGVSTPGYAYPYSR